MQTYMAGSAF